MFIKLSAIILGIGVCLGAFGAHALKNRFGEYEIGIWNTATLYLFIHGLALLVISLAEKSGALSSLGIRPTQYFFIFGIVVFSGSLYTLALSGVKILGAITPLGGIAMIIGWALLAYRA